MRQIGEFSDEQVAASFVRRLRQEHITALVEEDNGSYLIWVHEEGHIKLARNIYEELKKNDFKDLPRIEKPQRPPGNNMPPPPPKKGGPGGVLYQPYITKFFLFVCTFVYVLGLMQEYKTKEKLPGMLGLSKLGTYLLIDFPESAVITKELVDTYGFEKVKDGDLPVSAQPLIKKFNAYTPWMGVYNILVSSDRVKERLWTGEMFGDIKKGQIWRLFTPAVLHRELLHFLFNILLLAVLGRMVEFNMGRIKYTLFILLTGIAANLAQYMISGPFFMGISGVIAAFIGYIWVRRKRAPWEMYGIQKQTMTFFLIYIFGLLGIQGIIFLLDFFQVYAVPFHIANTAHVAGFLMGALFGCTRLFAKRV